MPFITSLAGRLALVVACLVLHVAYGQRNITADDDDPAFVYTPSDSWHRSPMDELDAGGRHMVTVDPTALATFTFTGIAVYFMSPLWADNVNTALSLDGGPSQFVDLRNPHFEPVEDGPSTVRSAVVWSAAGLDNVEHTLVMSVEDGERFAIVDMVIYTVEDSGDSVTTTTSSSSTSSAQSTTTSSPAETSPAATVSASTKQGLSIALGTVCSVFGLLVIFSVFWVWRRRRQRRREQELLAASEDNVADMSETNDPLPSEQSPRRYRSIPTANMPRVNGRVQPIYAFEGQGKKPKPPVPSRSTKPASKLRNVVATHDPSQLTTIPEASGSPTFRRYPTPPGSPTSDR